MSGSVKGALIISLGYVLMITAAIVAAFYIRKTREEMKDKKPGQYDLVGRIMEKLFRDDNSR